MRDPKRIKVFCDQLAEIWEENYPDWRFGQLVCNVFKLQNVPGFFHKEDDQIMANFKEYAASKAELPQPTIAAFEELADMEADPEKYKRYESFKQLMEEVLKEES